MQLELRRSQQVQEELRQQLASRSSEVKAAQAAQQEASSSLETTKVCPLYKRDLTCNAALTCIKQQERLLVALPSRVVCHALDVGAWTQRPVVMMSKAQYACGCYMACKHRLQ